MNVLVIGGSGFIGSHVADALSNSGYTVTIYDAKQSPYLRPDQKCIVGSTLDREHVTLATAGQDFVYNFAGIPHLDVGLKYPVETVEQNILATVITLEAAKQSGVKRYVYASSIYVYSESGGFYRCSKQAAELYIEEYQRLYGLDYTILRYGTIYGPRADDHNSIRRYLKQALKERRVTLSGTGDEVREYIHVTDAAQASVDILSDDYRNDHILLTGHHPMRYRDLLIMIREIVGRDIEIEIKAPDCEDPKFSASGHFLITPYNFRPRIAKKLIGNSYLDMGQGLLDCLESLYEEEMMTSQTAANASPQSVKTTS
jgi:UDP-glucose 4-epimerase